MRGAVKDVTYGFTDGSCRWNPGPCGAGACLFFPNQEKLELHQTVFKISSILPGELMVIKMESFQTESTKQSIEGVMLFSDSQSALGILSLSLFQSAGISEFSTISRSQRK